MSTLFEEFSKRPGRLVILLSIWAALLIFPALGLRHLWLPDEGRYAEVAREMVASHDWLSPQVNFQPHFTKPPLTYWLIALSLRTLGTNALAARLPSALALLATVLVIFFLAQELGLPRPAAGAAALMFLLAPLPFIAGNIITTDIFLNLFETLAIWLFWRAFRLKRAGRPALLAAYAALGLAFMTKGPVGILVPFLALAGYCIYRREWCILRESLSGWGLGLFALVAFPWFGLMVWKHHNLLSYFLGNEVAGRVFTTVHHRNNTFLMYPLVLLAGFLPWTWYLFAAIKEAYPWTRLKAREVESADAFLLSWLILPLVFFCLVRSRLPLYVLNLFAPLAILTAGHFFAAAGSVEKAWRRFMPIAVAASLVLMAVDIGAAFVPSRQDLYPLAAAMNKTASENDYRIYSYSMHLYSINFYTGREIRPAEDLQPLLHAPDDGFLIVESKDLTCESSHRLVASGAKLIMEYKTYLLFFHPSDSIFRAGGPALHGDNHVGCSSVSELTFALNCF
jgi:4-amino-4-deoxy-L-arabinose transferase-like glycosyltransferase